MAPSKHKDESKEERRKRKEQKKRKKAKRKREEDDLVQVVEEEQVLQVQVPATTTTTTTTTTTIKSTPAEEEENLGSSSLSSPKKKKSITDDEREQSTIQRSDNKGIESEGGVDGIKSPFQEKTVQILVSLPPSSLTNITNALNESIQKMLLKYSNSLGGVLVSFRDVELDDQGYGGGKIINEMPHIHYNVRCSVMVFNPMIGTVLSGKVNESFPSHVGVLVYELFNAMISAESLKQNGFLFDDETHEWRLNADVDNDVNEGRVVNIGDGMTFTVDKLHECNGLISLECADPTFINTTG